MSTSPAPSRKSFLLASPYGDAIEGALDGFFDCAKYLHAHVEAIDTPDVTFEVNKRIHAAMSGHINRNTNPHLFSGLVSSLLSEPKPHRGLLYRPTLLLKRLISRAHLIEQEMHHNRARLREARRRKSLDDDPIEISFSPFYFVRQYLTDPEHLATDAYAHALIRAQIFSEALKFAGRHPEKDTIPK